MAGEYVAEVLLKGIAAFLENNAPGITTDRTGGIVTRIDDLKSSASTQLGAPVPPRPPTFCTGCPERPVFTAIKLVQRELGNVHIAADIGCHTFSTLAPFNLGNPPLMAFVPGVDSRNHATDIRNKNGCRHQHHYFNNTPNNDRRSGSCILLSASSKLKSLFDEN